jgi:hypothetical protein
MWTRLAVDDQPVCTSVAELTKVILGLLDHHVDFQREPSVRSNSFNYRRTKRYGWDELAVHDVDVNAVGASLLRLSHLLAQSRKIGRQD